MAADPLRPGIFLQFAAAGNDRCPAPGTPIAAAGIESHLARMRILDVDAVQPAQAARLTPHLLECETVHAAFVSPTGSILFTDRRILMTTREHLLEERVETASWPYREVRHFSIQEGQAGGSRSALRIWLGAEPQPLHLRAAAGDQLLVLQRLLADRLV